MPRSALVHCGIGGFNTGRNLLITAVFLLVTLFVVFRQRHGSLSSGLWHGHSLSGDDESGHHLGAGGDPKNPEYEFWRNFPANDGLVGGLLHLKRGIFGSEQMSPHLSKDLGEAPNPKVPSPRIYDPYPHYASDSYKSRWKGQYVPCKGPRGTDLRTKIDDQVMAYDGVPEDQSQPALGSYRALGIDANVCFDRYSRYGTYGFGIDDAEFSPRWAKPSKVQWENVTWGSLQLDCVERNKDRFNLEPRLALWEGQEELLPAAGQAAEAVQKRQLPQDGASAAESETQGERLEKRRRKKPRKRPRTAVLLRSWIGYNYTANVLQNMRAMITELSLMSGGEYDVFLMVHVKDPSIPFLTDDATYDKLLDDHIPREFHDITEFWSEQLWDIWYPKVSKDHRDVFHAQWMPVQWFSQRHRDYDFFWNWEMDVRYTGHYFHLLDQTSTFAKKQPRKGLWERSSRFYIPELHGAYSTDFRRNVESKEMQTVWSPPRVYGVEAFGPLPPRLNPSKDNYKYGVGDHADLITFLPIFDPQHTSYALRHDAWGYWEQTAVPRRCSIVTVYRASKALLDAMHYENKESGHHMHSEMWPASVAMHHSFKAVYAPHPIFFDRQWPLDQLEKTFNPGSRGSAGGDERSTFGLGHEHVHWGGTFYYRADSAKQVYERLLGKESNGKGGREWEKQHGRACVPPMLLHPVKNINS
ncbi:MAG: hypothetical protein M1825_005294 [Sarcosagium campestre]|nr:MAG: hypothetical protein M1825_005294 [Sarcosagium campestre]